MSVWFAIPSARPPEEVEPILKLWRERGYKIALRREDQEVSSDLLVPIDPYPGWGPSVNIIARAVFERDPTCDWIVTGGDDTDPDPNHSAEEIARECSWHFSRDWENEFEGTFGVMQPTGDRWAGGSIDRICGSPWLGREFCRRMYGGRGPFWHEYGHMFADEELQNVALKLGVLWQRPDLTHLHKHYFRDGPGVSTANYALPIPEHMKWWAGKAHWDESKAMFLRRKELGFPGHEPI